MLFLARLCHAVSRFFAWCAGALFFLSAVLITLDVIFRSLFRLTIFESFELSSYAFAIATTLGLAYALISHAPIRIEIVYIQLPRRARTYLDIFAYGTLVAVVGVLAYWSTIAVMDTIAMGARSNSTLATPIAWPQVFWLLGLLWFTLVSLIYTLLGIAYLLRGQPAKAHELLGIATASDEINHSAPAATSPTYQRTFGEGA